MRIFKSDVLEFFTHINPLVVLFIWVPIIGVFIYLAIDWRVGSGFPVYIPLMFLAGLIIWTFAEYVLHRFLFHYEAKTERGKKISFMFHGVHHMQPMVKTRLVMPPAVSLPLAALFYAIFYLIFAVAFQSIHLMFPTFAGFAFGYLIYDMIHYSVHHFNLKGSFFKWVRKHHMLHHVRTPNARYGVTSPVWDHIFRTEPAAEKK